MDQKIAILGPKSWIHLWLDLGFRISKLAMKGGKKKKMCLLLEDLGQAHQTQ